jgi:ribose-phosphate pyrophosphokinase
VDNLFAGPIALSYFKLKALKNLVVVSPDAGGVTRAKAFLEGLSAQLSEVPSLAVIIKQRPRAGEVKKKNMKEEVNVTHPPIPTD